MFNTFITLLGTELDTIVYIGYIIETLKYQKLRH